MAAASTEHSHVEVGVIPDQLKTNSENVIDLVAATLFTPPSSSAGLECSKKRGRPRLYENK